MYFILAVYEAHPHKDKMTALIEILCTPDSHHARFKWSKTTAPCVIGKNGASTQKREGDGITPCGIFPIRRLWMRHDRLTPPQTQFDICPITPQSGWSDDPQDSDYNRPVALPHAYHTESLHRTDHLYDMFFELGINDNPPIAHHGSALFMHLLRNNNAATQGCVAISLKLIYALARNLPRNAHIDIKLS